MKILAWKIYFLIGQAFNLFKVKTTRKFPILQAQMLKEESYLPGLF